MSIIKEQDAQEKIMTILLQLNVIEAKNVLSAICSTLGQKNEHSPQNKRRVSKIKLDRELYEFIMSLDLEFMTQKDVLNACIDKFGKVRSPSKSALNRAFKKLLNEKGDK